MKLVFKNSALVLLCMMWLSGCVRELVPEDNGYKPTPVIWAILHSDSALVVFSSGNRGIADKDIVDINTVEMSLFEDGLKVAQLSNQSIKSEKQIHKFLYKPKPSKTYTLSLQSQSQQIWSAIRMPNLFTNPDEIFLSQGDNAQLKYTLTDDISYSDAYQFSVYMYHFGVLTDTSNNTILDNAYSFKRSFDKFEEPSLNFNFLESQPSGPFTYPLSDHLFSGKKKTFLFSIQNPTTNVYYRIRENAIGLKVSDKMTCTKKYVLIKSRKISPDYFKFLVSSNETNAIFGTPYYQPTNVHSNMNGGLGLLGAIVDRSDTLWILK